MLAVLHHYFRVQRAGSTGAAWADKLVLPSRVPTNFEDSEMPVRVCMCASDTRAPLPRLLSHARTYPPFSLFCSRALPPSLSLSRARSPLSLLWMFPLSLFHLRQKYEPRWHEHTAAWLWDPAPLLAPALTPNVLWCCCGDAVVLLWCCCLSTRRVSTASLSLSLSAGRAGVGVLGAHLLLLLPALLLHAQAAGQVAPW